MGYNEREELIRTDEWLFKVHSAGYSEELEHLPSESRRQKLSEPRVKALDDTMFIPVVHIETQDCSVDILPDHGSIELSVTMPVEVGEDLVGKHYASQLQETGSELVGVFDYDAFAPWDWFKAYDDLIASVSSVFSEFSDDLDIFNELVKDGVVVGV